MDSLELPEGHVAAIITANPLAVLAGLAGRGRAPVYVSARQPHYETRKLLAERRVDQRGFFFVDVHSGKEEAGEDAVRLAGKGALREVLPTLAGVRKLGIHDVVVLDGLRELASRNGEKNVLHFVHAFSEDVRRSGWSGVILATPDTPRHLAEMTGHLSDSCVEF